MAHAEFDVGGRLSESLLDLIRSRFGEVRTRPCGPGTTVIVPGTDPASVRALLTLLWDTGHDVVSMRSGAG
ncbi:hypothetical protein [Dactylosporangium sp. NPDC051541]|uniref:hypothetical protein n=1 Tax=Dactylosporangium sp. NPDC051541 TaxID=3363977 RepID=UPI003790106F